VNGDARSLPFRDNAFDIVLMVTVLGEVTDQIAAIKEVTRVLHPDGRLSITEAAGDPDRIKSAELDRLAAHAGLVRDESWRKLLVTTDNYRKPPALTAAQGAPPPDPTRT
jgi:ubiquinone/menaquinone biosynthesis C-methylase UbiE